MALPAYNCYNGYICRGSAIHPSNMDGITIILCPAGSYCHQNNLPAGSTSTATTQLPCPINYYNPVEGQSACLPCEAGFSCQKLEIIQPDPCPQGYYCPAFNPNTGVQNVIPCPAGTYSSDYYLSSVSQCNNCPAGKYCEIGSAQFTGYCDKGYICTGG